MLFQNNESKEDESLSEATGLIWQNNKKIELSTSVHPSTEPLSGIKCTIVHHPCITTITITYLITWPRQTLSLLEL
jgi:hypothetical protein